MKFIHLVTIDTEDGEHYKYAFAEEPSEKTYKKMFFDENPDYRKKDWGECIGHSVEKIKIV